MNKDRIIALPNPLLRERSAKVPEINDEIRKLVSDMTAVALDWEKTRPHEISAAMSAVQLGELKRVMIVRSDFDDKSNAQFIPLINAEIVKMEGDINEDYEGCLSVPDVYGKVPRNTRIRVRALDINGNEIRFKADGFLARLLQHEIDHINGIVFIDHIKNNEDAFYKLDEEGELQPLDYDKYIKNSRILW